MKQAFLFLSLILCVCSNILSQNAESADKLLNQAQANLGQREYTKARYFYLQAYKAFAGQQDYQKAIDCGTQAASLYHRENYYKEAFDLCREMEQIVAAGEQNTGKSMTDLLYKINKVRLQMYIALKRPQQSREFLDKIQSLANTSKDEAISDDYLYTQANYYYTFGMQQQGDDSFKALIAKYKKQKNYAKVNECYKTLISLAQKANNANLVAQTYEKYISWTDSAKALTAKDELSAMKRKFDESQQTIQDKDHSLSVKQYVIIGLAVVIAILAAGLILGGFVTARYILLARKQKRAIEIANEHNGLKTKFIQNISAQIAPTLEMMNPSLPGVIALRGFAEHIQELATLESTLTEIYEMYPIEVNAFCEKTIEKVEKQLKEGVSTTIDSPRLTIKTNPEQLERILLHLLTNAAEHTPEGGKIWLEFKKRGAHTHQFIVTNTGNGISVGAHENLFKPFSEIRNLSDGDGLGLPICALIATKMNGSLSLDMTYTRGCRFILELHA